MFDQNFDGKGREHVRIYKKNAATFMQILLTLCAVFLLHIILSPLAYLQELTFQSRVTRSSSSAKQTSPIERFGESYIISDFAGNDILTDFENNHIINRNLGDFRRLLINVINTFMLPLVSFGVLLYCVYIINKKPKQQIPVMAISIGGHAPPQEFRFNL